MPIKIIKKYEVEVVDIGDEVIVSVYPKPLAVGVNIASHSLRAKTFRRMSDEDRAATVRNAVSRCLTMLQEEENEKD